MFEMDKLSQQELVRIRRGAEDAIQAMNRNHRSFIEAVSHPLNIIALVDMAQASIGQQAKVEELQQENLRLAYGNTSYYNQAVKQNEIIEGLQKRVDAALQLIPSIKAENDLWGCDQVERQIELLEQALKGKG